MSDSADPTLLQIFVWITAIAGGLIGIYNFLFAKERRFEGYTKKELIEYLNKVKDGNNFKTPHPKSEIAYHEEFNPVRLHLEMISRAWRSNFFNKKEKRDYLLNDHGELYKRIYNEWLNDIKQVDGATNPNMTIVKNYLTPDIHTAYREMEDFRG
ncbi:hypothetical protein [Rheinheimera sp.]|uniref:hypothetical protein n=1 Tax=Rheinheimera sp. TaxID=1869214 RepID=UPI002736745D|nr:hypothetical protein [Rheinheimera sp.]MDP2716439.1 hypothetical protein [Rheinheimera sp.]